MRILYARFIYYDYSDLETVGQTVNGIGHRHPYCLFTNLERDLNKLGLRDAHKQIYRLSLSQTNKIVGFSSARMLI